MFGVTGDELRQLTEFKKSFVHRIESESLRIDSPEALQKFIDTRGNFIQLTTPRFVKVRRCQEQLDELFAELVGGEEKKGESRRSLVRDVRERFIRAGLEPYLKQDIHIPVPQAKREVKVPMGFQNGKFHLLQTVSFDSKDDDANFRKACVQSIQGRFVQDTPSEEYGPMRFNVIGRFASHQGDTPAMVRETLKDSDVRLFDERDLSELIDEIRRTGKAVKA